MIDLSDGLRPASRSMVWLCTEQMGEGRESVGGHRVADQLATSSRAYVDDYPHMARLARAALCGSSVLRATAEIVSAV